MPSSSYPRIPYGEADFKRIRLNRWLYVDKTRFVHDLEEERYVFLIRPRRFGKSCWVSLLDNYYSRTRADDFEVVFGGTDLGRQPTESRHRYVILRFNFSAFDDTLETLRQRFEEYCQLIIRSTLERNADLFPEAARQHIRSSDSVNSQLNELFVYAGDHGIPLYVLIDEYDNFANTVLAYHGEEAYQAFTHGGGFYRNFFATLKDGTGYSEGGLERMFITGVSPITMDDVTSGFNIGKNISLHPKFNDMLGFTDEEVRELLELYRDHGVFNQDVEAALDVMREWYNGYRFAKSAQDDLYNTDMVLYFLDESIPNRGMPDELIDTNVRIDYGKLRHLLTVNRQLNGNFDLLRHIIGEQSIQSNIQLSFPLDRLDQRENFLSLLHYFGLLSIRAVERGMPRLGIPNQTVKRLMYGYLRDAYDDVGVFSVDVYTFFRLAQEMAYDGAWQPVLDFLRDALAEQTGIRDYMDGEKVVHGFVAAHLSLSQYFLLHSEYELNKGYADLYLEPFVAQYSDMQFGYVLELKYLKRSESLDESVVADRIQ
ncbi:MAG: AAA family ATPase, partial [Gemmatimonadetes bacterium]|nr:AAA family ATPase [Gemmatimonadota bacterium]